MIPIYKPYMPLGLTEELNNVLYSGQLGFNAYGEKFENSLREYIGSDYILTINSYGIAMSVVLSTLGLDHGSEIITSPVSCLASNQPFSVRGIKIIWADINPNTGTLCPKDVESKITKNTKAIFHNHFCGYVGEIDEINLIGIKYGIPVIDDAIEAFGSEYKGNKVGNTGTDITVFSFQAVRLPNTIDGGAIAFKSKKLYEKAKLIRDYGIDRNNFRVSSGEINPNCDIKLEGYGGMMSEINSLIGCKQMHEIEKLISVQRENARNWIKELSDINNLKPLTINLNCIPNYWVFGILANKKDDALKYFKTNGYVASGVHLNNNKYSIFKNKSELKGVNEFMNHFIAVPSGWWFNKKN